jgi:hypothetical protein
MVSNDSRKDATKGDTSFDPLMPYLFFRAFGAKANALPQPNSSLYELALLDWMTRHQMCEGEPSLRQLQQDRQTILFQTAPDLRFESAPQAPFIWSGVTSNLFHALGEASLHKTSLRLNMESDSAINLCVATS